MTNQTQHGWAVKGNFPTIKYDGTSQFRDESINVKNASIKANNDLVKISKIAFQSVSSDPLIKNWQNRLPTNLNVFEKVDSFLPKILNSKKKDEIIDFVNTFKKILLDLTKSNSSLYSLPPMTIAENSDSIHMEWIFKDFRIVFSFQEKYEESYWFLVSNKNFKELSFSGNISDEKMDKTLVNLIQFALRFS